MYYDVLYYGKTFRVAGNSHRPMSRRTGKPQETNELEAGMRFAWRQTNEARLDDRQEHPMSLSGALTSAVTGIDAQSRALGAISDNISNSQTAGYKRGDPQ